MMPRSIEYLHRRYIKSTSSSAVKVFYRSRHHILECPYLVTMKYSLKALLTNLVIFLQQSHHWNSSEAELEQANRFKYRLNLVPYRAYFSRDSIFVNFKILKAIHKSFRSATGHTGNWLLACTIWWIMDPQNKFENMKFNSSKNMLYTVEVWNLLITPTSHKYSWLRTYSSNEWHL